MLCLVTESCPTLCHPVDCSPPGSSVLGESPGKNTRVGCHALLQGIFPIWGLNPSLLHCRWILYCLSHQGSLSTFVRSLPLLCFTVPILAWNVPLIPPIFLNRSLVFSRLLFSSFLCIFHWGRPSYLTLLSSETLFIWLYLSLSPWLFLLFFPQLFVKPPQTTTLPSCISFFLGGGGWFWSLPPVRHSVYQIYSLESICHLHCIIIRNLIQVIPEWPSSFLYFLQFKPEFGNKEFMIWASQLPVLFLLTVQSFSIFGRKEYNQSDSVLTIQWCPCVESSLVFLEEGVCYDQCVLDKTVSVCPTSFCTPRPKLPATPGISWLPTFAVQSPMIKRTSFFFGVISRSYRSS